MAFKKSKLEEYFILIVKESKLPFPIQEYRFNLNRKWRFDFAYPDKKIAIEIEGGIWIQGRHSRGKGMLTDMEKYNWAVINGWKILRYAQNNIINCINDLKILLN